MSPEQARGEPDRLGPATDIFGLGALLYVLLTGRAPYGGGSVVELLDRARRSEYAPPRSVRGGISPALEAICRKAMTAKPEDRYPSALDLAADVERWLADEPVAAFREPFSVRARRWVRKHARLATGAAVALVVGLASVGAIAWQREHALITTRVQKQRTREALDTMLSKEMIERLGTQKELTAGQRAFFQKALAYYREFADEAATDEEGRKLVADAHSRVGSLLTKLGAKADAEAAFSSAYLAYERLADRDAGEPEYRRLAGGCLNDLAIVRGELRKLQDAEAAARDAIALFTSLADKYPDNPAYRHDLARSHSNLGQVFAAVRKFAEAETEVRKCYSLQVELVEKFPHDRDLQRELAGCRNNLGLLTMEAGKFAAAEDLFRAALAHMSTETDLIRDDPDFRSQLARTQKSLGFLLEANGKHADAAAAYRDSIVHRQELVARYPGLREYAVDLGSSFNALGNMLNDKGDHAAAIECFRQAIAAVDPVVAKEPGLPGAREELCGSYGGRAASHTLLQQYADALTDWDRAEPLADGLKRDLVRLGRAETFARLGRTAEAVAIADKVLDANGAPPLLFTASCVYAAASTAEPSGAVGVKAVATLRRAFMNGAPIMPSLYACPGLASLRGRDDYAALLWDLADGVPAPPK